VVVLCNAPVERRKYMMHLLHTKPYVNKVKYIAGSPLNEDDLDKTDVLNAAAVFIISDKTCADEKQELQKDEDSILYAISCRFFCVNLEYMEEQARIKDKQQGTNVLRPRTDDTAERRRKEALLKRKPRLPIRQRNTSGMRELGPPLFVQLLNTRSMSHILWQALPQMVSKDIQVICLRQVRTSSPHFAVCRLPFAI
jgi:hypothetical protein